MRLFLLVLLSIIVLVLPLNGEDFSNAPYKYTQKPPVLLNHTGDIFELDNVRWGFDEKKDDKGRNIPKWRKAVLNSGKVTKAYLCIKLFAPEWIAGHGLMLFRFESKDPVTTNYKETSKGLFISVEAYLKEGQKYGIMEGMKRKWPTVWQLSSFEDYLQACAKSGKKLLMYELELSQEEVQKLLEISIKTSLLDHSKDMYHTIDASCVTAQVDMINAVVDKKRRIRKHFISKIFFNPFASLPRGIGVALKMNRLLRKKLPMFQPKERNKNDITTKNLHGDSRNIALKNINFFQERSKRIENLLCSNIDNGTLTNQFVKELLYNETSQYAPYLYIPGIVPGEENNGETIIGKNFGDAINNATSKKELIKTINLGFSIYRKGLVKRLILEGPDVSIFIKRTLDALEKGLKENIKRAQLDK